MSWGTIDVVCEFELKIEFLALAGAILREKNWTRWFICWGNHAKSQKDL